MKRLRAWIMRLGGLFRASRRTEQQEQELAAELESHLQMHIEDNLRAGMTPEQARRDARIKLGGVEQTKQACRERTTFPWIESLLRDVRYALRQLRRSPGFTVTAILTLALGIGANTAIFSVIRQALLSSLPVPNPQELVVLQYTGREEGHSSTWWRPKDHENGVFGYPTYCDLRDKATEFRGLLAMVPVYVTLKIGTRPEPAVGEMVSENYFETLGVHPALGRLLQPSDETAVNANPVVVLSFAYWTARFAMNPKIVGQTIRINHYPFTVVGVAGPGFHGVVQGESRDIFVPITMEPEILPGRNELKDRRSRSLTVVGRLLANETRQQAEVQLQPLWIGLRHMEAAQINYLSSHGRAEFVRSHLTLTPGASGPHSSRDYLRTQLFTIATLAGLVLVLTCLNLASLLLVHTAGQTKEIAIRAALGAGRWRTARQLLLEGFVLGMAGGTLGAMLAPAAITWYVRAGMNPNQLDALPYSPHLNVIVLAFNFGVALLVSLIFSVAPIGQSLRPDLAVVLNQQKGTPSGRSTRMRRMLVAAQFGFSLLLLVLAGLFAATLYNLRNVPTGFATDHLLTFDIDAAKSGYAASNIADVYTRVQAALAAQPGVRSIAATNAAVLTYSSSSGNITVPGYTPADGKDVDVDNASITPHYFSTLEIPLLAGRAIKEEDTATRAPVAVVNENFARRYFGSASNTIGHVFGWGGGSKTKTDITIVGVVPDTVERSLREKPRDVAYVPYTQWEHGRAMGNPALSQMTFYIRTWQAPDSAAASVRHAVASVDSNLLITNMHTMNDQIDRDTASEQIIATLAIFFAILATLLSAIGLYGVLSQSTRQRMQEIAIRMALGADRRSVLWLILREVVWIVGIGLVVAVPLSFLLARYVRGQLFGLSSYNPVTYIASVVLLVGVALLAGYLPARRAASIDPMQALRAE